MKSNNSSHPSNSKSEDTPVHGYICKYCSRRNDISEPPQDTSYKCEYMRGWREGLAVQLSKPGKMDVWGEEDTSLDDWLLELLRDYSGMDFCEAEECSSWQACKEFMGEVEAKIKAERAKLFEQIRSEVIGEDEEIVQIRKPTHGTCCTCQRCGLANDGDCQCYEMEERNENRAKLREALTRLEKADE